MANYILIGAKGKTNSVRTAAFGDIAENDHAGIRFLYSEDTTGFAGFLRRVSVSKKLNRIIKMPLRMHWEVKYRDVRKHLSDTEDNYIVFVPGVQLFQRVTPALIRNLRKKHPDCKLVFYFLDGVDRSYLVNGVNEAYLFDFLKQFDFVYTYSRQDAEKYKLRFIEIPVRHFAGSEGRPEYMLHFAGFDKNRADMLSEIKKRLDDAEISSFFQIVPTADSDRTRKDISYSAKKIYADVVQDTLKANCMLEIIAENNSSATLRYKEAVIYNKKLLTNNPEITRLPYYDARWMRYFEKPEDIDLDWVKRVENVDYGYKGDFDVFTFLDTVEKFCCEGK